MSKQDETLTCTKAIVALSLAVAATVLTIVIQYIATVQYNQQGQSATAAWGIIIFFYMVLSAGLVGWPLSITAIIVAIFSLKKGLLKPMAIIAIVVASINLVTLPFVALLVSAFVGQP